MLHNWRVACTDLWYIDRRSVFIFYIVISLGVSCTDKTVNSSTDAHHECFRRVLLFCYGHPAHPVHLFRRFHIRRCFFRLESCVSLFFHILPLAVRLSRVGITVGVKILLRLANSMTPTHITVVVIPQRRCVGCISHCSVCMTHLFCRRFLPCARCFTGYLYGFSVATPCVFRRSTLRCSFCFCVFCLFFDIILFDFPCCLFKLRSQSSLNRQRESPP